MFLMKGSTRLCAIAFFSLTTVTANSQPLTPNETTVQFGSRHFPNTAKNQVSNREFEKTSKDGVSAGNRCRFNALRPELAHHQKASNRR
jgi:hypothetical protein